MTMEPAEKEKTKPTEKEPREITFRCKFCGEAIPLGKMTILNRFFPPLLACQDCERKMR